MTMAKINANYEALYILDPSLSEEQIGRAPYGKGLSGHRREI